MIIKNILVIKLIFIINVICYSNTVDSLYYKLKHEKIEKDKINLILKLSYYYSNNNIDSADLWADKAIVLSKKIKYLKGIAAGYSNKGIINEIRGNYDLAIEFHKKSLNICRQTKDAGNIASCLNNIAIIYDYKGEYQKSLEYQFKSLNLAQLVKDTNSISASYLNIGIIYYYLGIYDKALDYAFKGIKFQEQKSKPSQVANFYNNIGMIYEKKQNYKKALFYYFKTLEICNKNNDKISVSDEYNNIGLTYLHMNLFDTALVYLEKSKKINEEIGRPSGISQALSNMGQVYKSINDFDNAEKCYNKSLDIQNEIGDRNGISNNYLALGELFFARRNYNKASEFFIKSIELAKEIKTNDLLISAYLDLSKAQYELKDYQKAYYYNLLYRNLNDSINNFENNQKIAQIEGDFEFEKKQKEIEFRNKQKELIAGIELQKQKLYRNFYFIGFGLMLILSIVIFRGYRNKRKANKLLSLQKYEIELKNEELNQQKEEISAQRDEITAQRDTVTAQKEHIEEIHKEVTDSINYATRLQTAILPDVSILHKYVSECFILFKPKYKVSGDFYWWAEVENNIVITVADCTGHGVPGAFMSMLGSSLLREIVVKEYITNPAIILKRLRKEIIKALKQKGISGEQKDGMDMSLITINTENYECQWAGANNPLYIVSSRQEALCSQLPNNCQLSTADYSLFEVKGDKMPIAIHERMGSFINHNFKLNKGDCIYLFSDGFIDQFGGPFNKKFYKKKLKELLEEINLLEMHKQKEKIEYKLNEWKGTNEQTDDITMVGIKI